MEEDAVMLDNIVVSANRSETKRREASNIVNVLDYATTITQLLPSSRIHKHNTDDERETSCAPADTGSPVWGW